MADHHRGECLGCRVRALHLMLRRSYGPPVAAMGGLDASVALWRDAVVANGGTVSAARLSIINTFVIAEVASGAWDLTDDYWSFWAENAVQALTSLKQRRLATAVNSPTFTADRGYAFNGTTNYINTGFIPSTHAVAMTGTSLRIAAYERVNLASSGVAAASFNFSATNLSVTPRASDRIFARINSDVLQTAATVTDSRGLTAVQRSASVYASYKNGSLVAFVGPPASEASTLPSAILFIGASSSNAGTPMSFRAGSEGFVCAGAPFSAAQELAQYNNVQAFATAVGAQV